MTLETKLCDSISWKDPRTEATRTEGKVCNWSHLRLSVFQEKPLGKVGRRVGKTNKVSQNDRLFSLFLHNWKERILLRTCKNTNNKLSLCILDIEWNMLDYLQRTYLQEPWVNCPNLPCKAESFSLCPSASNCLMRETFTRSWPRLPTIPSASPPCLFFSLFTHVLLRDERCFSFFGNFWLCFSVCGFLRNGCAGFLNSCSGQTWADCTWALNLFPLQ